MAKATGPTAGLVVSSGWTLFAHPLLLDQLDKLTRAVEHETRKRHSVGPSANAKLLAALYRLMFTDVPQDPTRSIYRQGGTLGTSRKHWFRAKFGNGRFRLFFRFDRVSKIIVYAWVNDETSLRTRGSRTDAYAVFSRMLQNGNPPDAWSDLLADSRRAIERLRTARRKPADQDSSRGERPLDPAD